MDIINVTCGEIQTSVGFLYVIQSVILNQTLSGDCEQSWYSEDGCLIADPSDPQTLNDPATAVKSDRLVTSRCVNLIHGIICDSADGLHVRLDTAFRARNETAATPNSDQSLWILAVFIIVILLILTLICFLWRKKKLRCFQSIFHLTDSENRDPETGVQMKLRSDESDSLNQSESDSVRDPETGVQMKLRSDESDSLNQSESDSVRDPETGVQMKLRSDESDSLNQSVLRSTIMKHHDVQH
ncbi:uncharacterized protein LOC107721798 [Sinocyclocheilus rhinocerous]|uniref:uncharacterized protein LOC107721798 n=1 Tax=Sinocyclocheilus rhinocerous TaxID=307959 RepID=UPI0007B8BA95|nr:PREDICTED: uncharacterized protein LOC107721798 [Sinocyclocheilus rhinocerous]